MKILAALAAAFIMSSAAASAQTQTSISKIAFGPANTLFAADWRTGRIYAYTLGPATSAASRPFNLLDLQVPLAKAVGTERFRVDDLAMRPGTNEAYIALDAGRRNEPAIVRVTPAGTVTKLDLARTHSTSVALEKTGGGVTFWDKVPERAYTVTDMKWHKGRLYVAGLANQSFSSTLRILSYPFASQTIASVEMYHTVHNQWETRAPIRAMTFANVGGVDTLLAGYLCSPLVSIPVASLVDGAHVKAKTLAELGVAGIPQSMIVYDQPDMQSGKSYPFVLITERYRPSVAIPLSGIEKENAGAGITAPPSMTAPPGANLGAIVEDFDGALRIDNQDATFFVALRRNLDTGAPELVSYDKRASFRLSDADVSEYDFPAYKYNADYQQKYILPMQNMLKKEEGYRDLVVAPKAP
ncbi:hypothetical protein WPS_03590 [Vulcanimicrobium alpinum]|uniref:Methanethiol oxidase n=2 Tax=Vulcanimicrobium alpinum TaxID=3016050 RepID=A0AAN2C8L6_UNVUL|nr:hypothetical protein WPS_03590 [Vulcanimicrobium alpinum]